MSEKIFDHFLQVEVENNPNLVQGVVGCTKDGSFILGSFSPSYNNQNIIDSDGTILTALSKEVVPDYYFSRSDSVLINSRNILLKNWNVKANINQQLKNLFDYSISSKTIERRLQYIDMMNLTPSRLARTVGKELKGLSVGVEFETAKGLIPKEIQLKSGLVPLRDGSIPGLEYVTVPLKGEKHAQILINAIDAISNYTTIDPSCALHYHFGGIPRTEKFIVALWRIINCFQNELYLLQPPYKSLNWGVKKKSYSKPLNSEVVARMKFGKEETSKNMAHIYASLTNYRNSYDEVGRNLNNIVNHPADPEGRQKWNITERYSIVNFIPLIFGNKQTVEFRLSEINTNKSCIINEILFFASIINFTIDNQDSIIENPSFLQNLSVSRAIESTKSDMRYDLIEYYLKRKEVIENCVARNNMELLHKYSFKTPYEILFVGGTIDKKDDLKYFHKHSGYERDEVQIYRRPFRRSSTAERIREQAFSFQTDNLPPSLDFLERSGLSRNNSKLGVTVFSQNHSLFLERPLRTGRIGSNSYRLTNIATPKAGRIDRKAILEMLHLVVERLNINQTLKRHLFVIIREMAVRTNQNEIIHFAIQLINDLSTESIDIRRMFEEVEATVNSTQFIEGLHPLSGVFEFTNRTEFPYLFSFRHNYLENDELKTKMFENNNENRRYLISILSVKIDMIIYRILGGVNASLTLLTENTTIANSQLMSLNIGATDLLVDRQIFRNSFFVEEYKSLISSLILNSENTIAPSTLGAQEVTIESVLKPYLVRYASAFLNIVNANHQRALGETPVRTSFNLLVSNLT